MPRETVTDLVRVLETIAPPRFAEPWDNVGLLVGARDWPAERVLLAIDLTAEVLAEAVAAKTQAIVAYHPLLFAPLKAFSDADPKARLALDAARAGIAVYAPHTALDAAPGGVNDWLAEAFGPGAARPLVPHAETPASEAYKLVTFCPRDVADGVRRALAAAGCGRIGAYEECSFEIPGTGTFVGGPGTAPAVGRRGRLERVEEVRLEMVAAAGVLAGAVTALRAAHPYEEPPVEVYRLAGPPSADTGAGRAVALRTPLALAPLLDRVRTHLRTVALRMAAPKGAPRRHAIAGVCPGAGASLVDAAHAAGCTLFLTGEMRHHDVLDAVARGMTVVLAGHTETERPYLRVLRKRMAALCPNARITVSRRDRAPLSAAATSSS